MEVLFEDKDIAVIVKPMGLDSEKGVPQALAEKLGGAFYPVHRLDLNVGGVMVYARNPWRQPTCPGRLPRAALSRNMWHWFTEPRRKREIGLICCLRTAEGIKYLWCRKNAAV